MSLLNSCQVLSSIQCLRTGTDMPLNPAALMDQLIVRVTLLVKSKFVPVVSASKFLDLELEPECKFVCTVHRETAVFGTRNNLQVT